MPFQHFILDFLQHLRQHGLQVTMSEYLFLQEAIQKGFVLEEKDKMLEICQLLWAKDQTQLKLIEQEFHSYYKVVLQHIISTETKASNVDSNPKSTHSTAESQGTESKSSERTITPKESKSIRDSDQNRESKNEYGAHDTPVIAFYPNQGHHSVDTQLYPAQLNYIQSPFIIGDDYLPLSQRQMQQIWRKLRRYSENRSDVHVNWKNTINLIAKHGFFTHPAYQRKKENQIQLFILLDQQGSMIAHESLGNALASAALNSGEHASAQVYYTHNVPNSYLYKNAEFTDALPLKEVWATCAKRHSVFLIFSDAGASRSILNPERVSATRNFLNDLRKNVNAIVWINPMPKERWADTAAEWIQLLVPMFECTSPGMEAAIQTLKTGRNGRI